MYRKGLRLRGADVSRMGVGGIANLQSNDVQKMARFALDINPIWDGPFQVCTDFHFTLTQPEPEHQAFRLMLA